LSYSPEEKGGKFIC